MLPYIVRAILTLNLESMGLWRVPLPEWGYRRVIYLEGETRKKCFFYLLGAELRGGE